MEIFGIVFSIPVALIANALYCLFLAKRIVNADISRTLRLASCVVLSMFAAEIILLVTLGAVRSRGLLGPAFYVVHSLLFFLGPPALANLLVLRNRGGLFRRWYMAAVACTVFAFFLVLLQYGVSESLYGINGDDGPYSGNVTLQQ